MENENKKLTLKENLSKEKDDKIKSFVDSDN